MEGVRPHRPKTACWALGTMHMDMGSLEGTICCIASEDGSGRTCSISWGLSCKCKPVLPFLPGGVSSRSSTAEGKDKRRRSLRHSSFCPAVKETTSELQVVTSYISGKCLWVTSALKRRKVILHHFLAMTLRNSEVRATSPQSSS